AQTNGNLLAARSTNNGATWSAPGALNANSGADASADSAPRLATDGAGNWIAVWQSSGGFSGGDLDIHFARSGDNGATWSAPAALNTNAPLDSGDDSAPALATDRAGNWVVAWQSTGALGGALGSDLDILVARSTNNGATWTPP